MAAIWVGIGAGKTHHYCVAIEESGRQVLSRRIAPASWSSPAGMGDDGAAGTVSRCGDQRTRHSMRVSC
ncbi:hypothetical protein SCOCK_630043 [Actinacidiphila cocklensis]|uniref:Transposase n=1 Tax=Actinacidiphila cocklensis TaxID=887465 RepID=A0A9W4GVN0_9ACTN|nr:hypothetical protein SCOCK_630043 [Actinacidiphila cocklensis]